jgi:hypothetical protein
MYKRVILKERTAITTFGVHQAQTLSNCELRHCEESCVFVGNEVKEISLVLLIGDVSGLNRGP